MIIVTTLERLVMEAKFARLFIALYGEHRLSFGNLIFGPKCGGLCFVLPDGLHLL